MRASKSSFLPLLFLIAVIGLGALAFKFDPQANEDTVVGNKFPNFNVTTVAGKNITNTDFTGKG